MRRPLLLLSFVPLLLTTMGVGPCDPQPLGRVDAGSERPNEPSADGGAQRDTGGGGCTVDGVTYEVGRAVPSRDDCNTCTCAASGEIACTKVACADAGRDTGGPVVCAFNDARYPAGATFPDTDGCNTCTCGRDGVVACTLRFCIPPDGGAGGAGGNGGVACAYGGVRYEVGVSFRSGDGCNTCTCLADGRVVCTDIACDRDGGVGGACVVGDTKYEAGATFPSRDGCNTCTCNRDGTIACTERACPPDAGRDTRDEVCRVGEDWTCNDDPTIRAILGVCRDDGTCDCRGGPVNPLTRRCGPAGDAGTGCSYGGTFYPVGTSFPSIDRCNTCTCTDQGIACTLRACPTDCRVDAVYQWGNTGGLVAYEDRASLSPPDAYLYSRRSASLVAGLSCAPPLPMCGGGGIDAGVVMRAIQDAEVQKALSLTTPPLFGRDNRPVDGTVFQFLRGDGRGFLVGTACDAAVRDCVAVPAGIDRLVTTLRDLDRQQLRDPSCAGLVTTGVR